MKEIRQKQYWVALGDSIPDTDAARRFVQDPSCGATFLFTGTTRDHHNGRQVTHLFYDCYEEMALRELEKIAKDVLNSFPVHRIVLFHKTGDAPIGTVSLVTSVSAAHRGPAMEATTELVDSIKESLPVWKRESFANGESVWKEEQTLGRSQVSSGRDS